MAKKKPPITLSVKNLAQIREGTVEFGDLTLIVGAQASGKSILLQMMKLLLDRQQIFETLQLYAYDWGGDFGRFLDMYFGESMAGIWKSDTSIEFNKKKYNQETIMNRKGPRDSSREENMFYIPAQRVVTITQGWPRPFHGYDAGDPYILKSFSETVRVLMEKESSGVKEGQGNIFPKTGKISSNIRQRIDQSIFFGGSIELDKSTPRKRFLLRVGDSKLPFMTWSAGQKEFMPLLLSLYHLIPSGGIQKIDGIDWVVIEEPEMGLHPEAIQTVMLLALQLLQRGYKVIISTHSPVLLELIWVINNIKSHQGNPNELFKLFKIAKSENLKDIFKCIIQEKQFKTWYFQRQEDGIHIRNISGLDAGSDDPGIATWGGLSEFASRAVDIVSNLAANEEMK
jgi:predicted ATPase